MSITYYYYYYIMIHIYRSINYLEYVLYSVSYISISPYQCQWYIDDNPFEVFDVCLHLLCYSLPPEQCDE